MSPHRSPTRQASPGKRQADLAAIHIAQKALGMTKDDALALKMGVVGVASSAAMSDAQRAKYLAHLSGLQGRMRAPAAAYQADRPAPQRSASDPLDERWHKARVLWHNLALAGQVRNDTDQALMGYVTRQTKLEHWRFLNTAQVNSVIEALKRWCVRTGVATKPEGATHG